MHASNLDLEKITCYKGSAPRAAESVRYARARNKTTCEGGRKKRPMILVQLLL